MALRLITGPASDPITLAEAKAHMRVDASTEDSLITAMISAATQAAEQMTGRRFVSQTWELTLDEFPSAFELTSVPVLSITSLKYYDAAGVQQTLDPSAYSLDIADDAGFAYVVPAYGTAWPESRGQINAIALRYIAGYSTVPESVKSWIKLRTSDLFENRSAHGDRPMTSPSFVDGLLDRFKVYA